MVVLSSVLCVYVRSMRVSVYVCVSVAATSACVFGGGSLPNDVH